MRYQIEMETAATRDVVVDLFLDPENPAKWQPDLVSFEHVVDVPPRTMGAQTK